MEVRQKPFPLPICETLGEVRQTSFKVKGRKLYIRFENFIFLGFSFSDLKDAEQPKACF